MKHFNMFFTKNNVSHETFKYFLLFVIISIVMKKVLILQFRPEKEVSDDEFKAFLKYGGLNEKEVERIEAHEGFKDIDLDDYSALIIGGSPYSVSDGKKTDAQIKTEEKLFKLMREVKKKDFPYWGNCYGLGTIATACNGIVSQDKYSESVGAVEILLNENAKKDDLLSGLDEKFYAFVGHKEACQIVPPDAILLASSKTCPIQLIRYGKNVYASQFHAELDSDGLALRIEYYKDKGYFKSEDAEKLIKEGYKYDIKVPMKFFKRFIDKYHR